MLPAVCQSTALGKSNINIEWTEIRFCVTLWSPETDSAFHDPPTFDLSSLLLDGLADIHVHRRLDFYSWSSSVFTSSAIIRSNISLAKHLS